MKTLTALVTVYGLILMPLYANAAALGGAPVFRPAPAARSAAEPSIAVGAEVRGRRAASTPVNEASSPVAYHSLLEAAEIAASSGAYRAQNTPDITTGLIREGDKKRSALAFALSGVAGVCRSRTLAVAALPRPGRPRFRGPVRRIPTMARRPVLRSGRSAARMGHSHEGPLWSRHRARTRLLGLSLRPHAV